MHLIFDFDTIEAMSDGVVLLGRDGQITDFNQAAKHWLPLCSKSADKIKAILTKTLRNKSKTPLLLDLFSEDQSANALYEVRLCNEGNNGFALLFTKKRFSVIAVSEVWKKNNFMQLMGDAMRHDLTEIIHEFDEVLNAQTSVAMASVKSHAQHLQSMFAAVEQLSRLADVTSMYPGDRVEVRKLLRSSIAAMQPSRCDYYKDVGSDMSAKEIGFLYGNESWLRCAITALLKGLEAGVPYRSQVNLTARQHGGFVTISAKSSSASLKRGVGTFHSQTSNDSNLHLVASTQVPLARRIIELHGGMLHVTELDPENSDKSFAIESFILQLPSGSPVSQRSASCQSCIVIQQNVAYAYDLAALTPCTPSEAHVSDEERALLTSIAATLK